MGMIADGPPQMPEVRNGKIKRRRPAVVRDVEYDVFGL